MKIGIVGLGYFSRFHLNAWQMLGGVEVVCGMDPDPARREWAEQTFGIKTVGALSDLLTEEPEVVDIIAPPSDHLPIIRECASEGRVLICQKPFCTSYEVAKAAVAVASGVGAHLIVHENFRFQPWHRTVKSALDRGLVGQVYSCQFNLRPGDGRGPEAYLDRQPAFQKMPRLLVYETGVHFIDLFRWYFGEITDVYADLARLNPVISGEDAGLLVMNHRNGVRSVFDGNRLMDHVTDNPRRTMGEMYIEGELGVLRLDGSGLVSFRGYQASHWEPVPVSAKIDDNAFGGGCVANLIRHVAMGFDQKKFENPASDYLAVVRAVEAAYKSAETGTRVSLS